jgi:hypothetical protein
MSTRANRLFLVFSVIILAGCITNPVGDVEKLCIDSELTVTDAESEWILVGNLFGKFDAFESEDVAEVFSIYSGCTTGQASLQTVDDFERVMSGWTTIETYLINLVLVSGHRWHTALVPMDVLDKSNFSKYMPGGWGGRGSLVAAKSTHDGVFVVVEILCNKGAEYSECAADYERGLFNLESGFQFGFDGEKKESEVRIDTASYKTIE